MAVRKESAGVRCGTPPRGAHEPSRFEFAQVVEFYKTQQGWDYSLDDSSKNKFEKILMLAHRQPSRVAFERGAVQRNELRWSVLGAALRVLQVSDLKSTDIPIELISLTRGSPDD
jgi:hypothetical protein